MATITGGLQVQIPTSLVKITQLSKGFMFQAAKLTIINSVPVVKIIKSITPQMHWS